MSARRFGVTVAAGLVWVAALLPPVAAAERGSYVVEPGYNLHLRLRGSAGYRIDVAANSRHYVTVTTRRGGAVTRYQERAPLSPEYGIDARLAGLGRLAVEFRPDGRERHLPKYSGCDGPAAVVREGLVRGRIRFRGEHGYTRVAAQHAVAEVESWEAQRCRFREAGDARRPHKVTASFSAILPGSGPYVELDALRFSRRFRPAAKQVFFSARTFDRRGPLWIARTVSVAAGLSSFQLPEGKAAPEHLVIAPPAPFSGYASFQRTPESTFTWEGPLAVEFPGVGFVPLAGPGFETTYCALRGCIEQSVPGGR